MIACSPTPASGPAPTQPSTITIDATDVEPALAALVDQLAEPVGLLAVLDMPKLGLQKGDLVRAINGEPAWGHRSRPDAETLLYLDVLRGSQAIVIRIAIRLGSQDHALVRRLQQSDLDNVPVEFKQITSRGKPSGIVLSAYSGILDLRLGDIVRKIDGTEVDTIDQALAALGVATNHGQIVLEIERLDQRFTYTLRLDDPPDADPAIAAAIAEIKQTDDAMYSTPRTITYEVPRTLVDAVLANPTRFARGARVVPAVKDGTPDGFKIYAIRPGSIFAVLGLTNGDTVQSINEHDLTATKKADIETTLRDAKTIKIDLIRGGRSVTLQYNIE